MGKDKSVAVVASTEELELERDIEAYKNLERVVIEDFLNGLIKLGALLKEHRDKHKATRTYTDYLEGIGRSISAANQLIRIYEYSVEHLSTLLESNLTNWSKVNMFLSLPEPLRKKLSKEIKGEEVSTEEFREKIADVKDEPVEIVDEELPVEGLYIKKMISGASLADIPFMAKKMVDELSAKVEGLTTTSIPLASGFLYLEKALLELNEGLARASSEEEAVFWKKILEAEIKKLNTLINGL